MQTLLVNRRHVAHLIHVARLWPAQVDSCLDSLLNLLIR